MILAKDLPAHHDRLIKHRSCQSVFPPGLVDDAAKHERVRDVTVIVSIQLPVLFRRLHGELERFAKLPCVPEPHRAPEAFQCCLHALARSKCDAFMGAACASRQPVTCFQTTASHLWSATGPGERCGAIRVASA